MRSLLFALVAGVLLAGPAQACPCAKLPHVRQAVMATELLVGAAVKVGVKTVQTARRIVHNAVVAPAAEFHKHRVAVRANRCGCDCGQAVAPAAKSEAKSLPEAPQFNPCEEPVTPTCR